MLEASALTRFLEPLQLLSADNVAELYTLYECQSCVHLYIQLFILDETCQASLTHHPPVSSVKELIF